MEKRPRPMEPPPPPLEATYKPWGIEQILEHMREHLATYDSAIASGQPVIASFSAHLESIVRELDIEWTSFDKSSLDDRPF
ncbi:hypothetical protein VE02_00498 [Pseudogymnoascus sp. 03VT05]|nr:hypothetical protein VE02_00498 [Pseudogymnoascus sp. 03VT05]